MIDSISAKIWDEDAKFCLLYLQDDIAILKPGITSFESTVVPIVVCWLMFSGGLNICVHGGARRKGKERYSVVLLPAESTRQFGIGPGQWALPSAICVLYDFHVLTRGTGVLLVLMESHDNQVDLPHKTLRNRPRSECSLGMPNRAGLSMNISRRFGKNTGVT